MKKTNKNCELLSTTPEETKKEGLYTRISFEYKNVEDNQGEFNHSLIKELSNVFKKYFNLKEINFEIEGIGYNIKNKNQK